MSSSYLIPAIFLQLCSTSFNYIGMTVQKKAAATLPEISKEAGILQSIKNFGLNKGWLLGYALNIVSFILNAAALALASISIIQPLYGFGLIVLVVFSHFYLKEKITRIDIFGVVFGIVGIVVIGVTAKPHEVIGYTALLEALVGTKGLIFMGVALSIAILSYLVSEKKSRIWIVFLVISSSIWTASAFLFSKAMATIVREIGIIGALFGEGWLYTWAFFGLFVLVSAVGLLMLNIAYQKGQCVIIIPIWTSIQVALPVLSGIIIFNEWATLTTSDIVMQSIGIAVMLVSIVILSISNGRKEDEAKLCKTTVPVSKANGESADTLLTKTPLEHQPSEEKQDKNESATTTGQPNENS